MMRSLLTVTLLLFGIVSVVPFAAAQENSVPPYPDPRRFEDAIEAFEILDRVDPPPLDAVLCIGSSSMRFWHDTLADDLQPLTLIGRGFGGSTMLDVLYYSSRIVAPSAAGHPFVRGRQRRGFRGFGGPDHGHL